MIEDIKELEKQIKSIRATKEAECHIQKGDPVYFLDGDGKAKYGRVDYVYYSAEDKIVKAKIVLPVTSMIGWSSSSEYSEASRFTKCDEPKFDQEKIDGIEQLLVALRTKRRQLDIEEYNLNKDLNEARSGCLHIWGDFNPTGEVRKHLIGESEVKIAFCTICGGQGTNC